MHTSKDLGVLLGPLWVHLLRDFRRIGERPGVARSIGRQLLPAGDEERLSQLEEPLKAARTSASLALSGREGPNIFGQDDSARLEQTRCLHSADCESSVATYFFVDCTPSSPWRLARQPEMFKN